MVQSPLLHLVHSSSGAPTAMSSSEVRTPSQRVTVACSKSTSKPRPKSSGHNGDGDEDNTSGNVSLATLKRRQQSNPSGLVVSRTTRSAPPSPSAWALSPGQSLLWAGSLAMEVSSGFNAPRASTKKPESKTNGGGGNGGAVSKVLKYFKPKRKVSPVQEEEIHKLRILHSSLLQWRKLSVLRENFSTFKMKFLKFDIPLMALTATATNGVREDVIQCLCMSKETKIVLTSFYRSNLRFSVKHSRTSSRTYKKDFHVLIKTYGLRRKIGDSQHLDYAEDSDNMRVRYSSNLKMKKEKEKRTCWNLELILKL
ncbi:QWRF motif-containing protein 7 [Eucalyptus grandis]|nr:QWRF motif-containing protein 7 [Eucalyptus grandis]